MYNGVGIPTARGTGTNGYVQKNWSHVKRKTNVDYRNEQKRVDQMGPPKAKKPNKEILEHERKRKVELRIAEFEDAMEEQGYSEAEIEKETAALREKMRSEELKAKSDADSRRRPMETHQIAESKQREMNNLASALGVERDSRPGDSFNAEIQAERIAREKIQREVDKKDRHQAWKEREAARDARSARPAANRDDMEAQGDRGRGGGDGGGRDRRSRSRSRSPGAEREAAARREQGRKAREGRRSPEKRGGKGEGGGGWDGKRSDRDEESKGGGWDTRGDADSKRQKKDDSKDAADDQGEADDSKAAASDDAPKDAPAADKQASPERKKDERRRSRSASPKKRSSKKKKKKKKRHSSSSSDTSSSSSSSSSDSR